MECQHFIILIILSVTVFSFVIMSLRRTKFEENTEDIQKKIERAKNLLISGNSKKAHDILELSLSELLSWKKVPDLVIKEKYQELSTEINLLLHDIEQEERIYQRLGNDVGDEIKKLAVLRVKGMISDQEFEAFSERFKVSTGEKARDIISAISDLHDQYKNDAMSEGNYRASLWSLLDKLDRKI